MVCCKICFFKFFNSWKMLKMLKIGCFKLFKAKSLYLRYTSRYSHGIFCSTVVKVRLLWPVSHIFAVVCSKICFFKYFSSWKILKMLRIGCFNLFLAKSLYLMYVSRYSHPIFYSTVVKVRLLLPVSHIFRVVCSKLCFLNFSIAGNCSKCLK